MARTRLAAGRRPPKWQQAVPGRLFDEFGDQLVYVQVAEAHGDGHHFRSRFPDLVDYILDGHGRAQLDRHESFAPVLHPFSKRLHTQRVDAIADGAGQHPTLFCPCLQICSHELSS